MELLAFGWNLPLIIPEDHHIKGAVKILRNMGGPVPECFKQGVKIGNPVVVVQRLKIYCSIRLIAPARASV
jgi:hypothetical protein